MKLDLSKDARDFLDNLQPKQFKQVATKIHDLIRDPSPTNAKHLSGYPGYKRIASGEFRICYRVNDDVIYVAVVGKRNDDEVYRTLSRAGRT